MNLFLIFLFADIGDRFLQSRNDFSGFLGIIPKSGYLLTKQPEEYPVIDILKLTEGSLATVACLEEGADKCPHMDKCKTLSMWQGYDELTNNYFSKITIKDLL